MVGRGWGLGLVTGPVLGDLIMGLDGIGGGFLTISVLLNSHLYINYSRRVKTNATRKMTSLANAIIAKFNLRALLLRVRSFIV